MAHRAAHGLAVVTGASSGIGAAIAAALAVHRGQPMLAVARRGDRLDALVAELRGEAAPVYPLVLDLAQSGPVETEFGVVAGYGARLLTPPGQLDAQAAARAALVAADRGRAVAIPGSMQRATALAAQLLPRAVVRRASRVLLRPAPEDASGWQD